MRQNLQKVQKNQDKLERFAQFEMACNMFICFGLS